MHTLFIRSPLSLWALVVLVVFFGLPTPAQALSTRPRPLKRVAHPSTLVLEILPRTASAHRRSFTSTTVAWPDDPELHHTDAIRLTLSSFSQDFHLHLRPSEHLIHPSARINYYALSKDGTSVLQRTEPLVRDAILAFSGDVVHGSQTFQRLREDVAGGLLYPSPDSSLGWARIVVHHQGDISQGIAPIFEGSFSVDGIIHHVVTTENYLRNRHPLDPDLVDVDSLDAGLVIYRDSDVMSVEEEASIVPDEPPSPHTCTHDSLNYNTDIHSHPVLRVGAGLDDPFRASSPVPSWLDPLWFNPTSTASGENEPGQGFIKRDDVSGNVSSNFIGSIGSTAGCSTTQKILYMGVAADCAYTSHYGGVANATNQILNNWNIASALYKSTFNVSLGIVEINVQDPTCPSTPDPNTPWNIDCNSSATLNDRLSSFSQWRGKKGDKDGAGLWHLMSGCPTGSEVGVAWLGTLCQVKTTGSTGSFVSGTGVSTASRTEWGVVAHEIGHNFGAIHDCSSNCALTDSCCPSSTSSCDASGKFLMNPVSSSQQSVFSPCTIGNICTAMTTMNDTCLEDASKAPRKTISLQQCGNGIVEPGEDCDPGLGRNSTCCDSKTCKFTSGSVCDPMTSECCTSTCQLAPSTQICRPARDGFCDMPEMCSGNNASCPADQTRPNGEGCGDGLSCASGVCTSRNQQCKTIGASMNLTTACRLTSQSSCSVSCQDPNDSRECLVLQSIWMDGTTCGYGGTCNDGKCQPGSLLDTGKAWFVNNLSQSIPIAVVAGLLVLFILWALFLGLRRLCLGGPRDAENFREGHVRIGSAPSPYRELQAQPSLLQNAPQRAVLRRLPPTI